MKPTISVIVLNYKNYDLLDKCMKSISNNTYKDIEVIYLDNTYNNIGPAKAFNNGVKFAKGDWITFLPVDVELDKDFFQIISESLYDVIIPKIYLSKGGKVDSAGEYLTWTGFLRSRHQGYENDSSYIQYPVLDILAKGCGVTFRKSVLEKIGLFDEDYFMYLEDTDLIMRAIMAGYTTYFQPRAIIYHKCNSSINQNPNKKFILNYYGCRNYILTLIKNLPLKQLIYVLPIHITLWLIYGCIKFKLHYYLLAMASLLIHPKIVALKRSCAIKTAKLGAFPIANPTFAMFRGKI